MIRVRESHFRPRAPSEFAYAINEWARNWGRTGKLIWVPNVPCWAVTLSRFDHDPLRGLVQQGAMAEDECTESVLLVEPHPTLPGRVRMMDIEQMGVSGLIEWLDKRNLWSGRGEHSTPEEVQDANLRENAAVRQKMRDEVGESAAESAWLHRREIFDIPLVQGADLSPNPKPESKKQ